MKWGALVKTTKGEVWHQTLQQELGSPSLNYVGHMFVRSSSRLNLKIDRTTLFGGGIIDRHGSIPIVDLFMWGCLLDICSW